MKIAIALTITVSTFLFMEFVAWSVHKYIMHGFLWRLHKDHHQVNKEHVFQKNDYFFLIFAIPSILLIFNGFQTLHFSFFIGIGIALYGFAYFVVHEIIIHQRIKLLRNINSRYIKAIRMAHKVHHKNIHKHNCTSFGMLIVSLKYFKR